MNQKALIIGDDDYALAPLMSCAKDAVAMRDLMVALRLGAVEPFTNKIIHRQYPQPITSQH